MMSLRRMDRDQGRLAQKHKQSTQSENQGTHLIVEAVIIAGVAERVIVLHFSGRGEAEEAATSRILQALGESLVATDLDVTN